MLSQEKLRFFLRILALQIGNAIRFSESSLRPTLRY